MKLTLALLSSLVLKYSVSATQDSSTFQNTPPTASSTAPQKLHHPESPENVYIPMKSSPYPTMEDKRAFENSLPSPIYIPHPDEVKRQLASRPTESGQRPPKRKLSAQERRDIEMKRSLYAKVLVRCPVTTTNPSYHQLQALGYRLQEAERFDEARRCFDDARALYTSRISLFGNRDNDKLSGPLVQKAVQQGYMAGKDHLPLLNIPGMPVDPLLRQVHRQSESHILYDDPKPAGGYGVNEEQKGGQKKRKRRRRKGKGKRRGKGKGKKRGGKVRKVSERDGEDMTGEEERKRGEKEPQNTKDAATSRLKGQNKEKRKKKLKTGNRKQKTVRDSGKKRRKTGRKPSGKNPDGVMNGNTGGGALVDVGTGTNTGAGTGSNVSTSTVTGMGTGMDIGASTEASVRGDMHTAVPNTPVLNAQSNDSKADSQTPSSSSPSWRIHSAEAWQTVPALRRRLMHVYNTQMKIQQDLAYTPMQNR